MDDERIVDLYWERSENAIAETSAKYGRYCKYIAYNILQNHEDSEECVNDTYMKAWAAMPSYRPSKLSAFLGKITRNLSLNRYKKSTTQKRGAGQIPLALDELQECLPSSSSVEKEMDDILLKDALNQFLSELDRENRIIFMQRYWYLCSIKEIAKEHHFTESKVKMILSRLRSQLKIFFEKEGIEI